MKNAHEETLFQCEDFRYEMDSYLNMMGSTIAACEKLQSEHEKEPDMSEEKFIQLRDKYVGKTKIKWIKHIYNCTPNSNENDSRYDFLNLRKWVVLGVIIERLKTNKANWEKTLKERQK